MSGMGPDPATDHARAAFTTLELAGIGDLIYRATGMVFGESKRFFIERRIIERMARCQIPGVEAYLRYAAAHPSEREILINAFTINESYFYREEHQFAALGKDILPAIVATRRPGDLVRIWSMPCSNGEEAYSIAIWLLENWPMVDAYNIEIVGSDIDSAALAAAREGWYGAKALARLPADVIERYFGAEENGQRRIIADLRDAVEFTPVNIVDGASVAGLGRFDVIFCRNLLIYFDDRSRREAVAHLHAALNPGGYVCLGHSESMARISDGFTTVRFDDAIVYRKT